jgi:SPP1 family predicted phage head-tail adaptor
MSVLGPKTSVGDRPHVVTLQNPGPGIPNDDGGSVPSWIDLVPLKWTVKVAPATAADLERVTAGTVLATATHIVTGPYRPDVTTQTRVSFNGRQFSVTGVSDPEERHVETIAVCVEIVS